LNCTLDDYFALFLADQAPHSFHRFQSEVIADKDATISAWSNDTTTVDGCTPPYLQEFSRRLTFTHPIKTSIGPSEAQTQRIQALKRFSSHGMILTNSTQVTGIPAADCFKAEDFWIIEAIDGGSGEAAIIVISARFAPRFHKRTMLKGLIERSIKRETTEWFRLYFDMVRTALEDRATTGKSVADLHPPDDREKIDTTLTLLTALQRIYPILVLIVVLLIAICALAAVQAVQTFKMMKLLEVQHDPLDNPYTADNNRFCASHD
jgi:VAD1 Analog of StAR-related lipid transfer domain